MGGVLVNRSETGEVAPDAFKPLRSTGLPSAALGHWPSLTQALPDLTDASTAPKPVTVDVAQRKVSLFLPGFDKKQVKLSQSGPEVTIEAGDQRRNLFLPPELSGRSATGAKFQDGYLIVSF